MTADLIVSSITGGQVERYMDADRITCIAVSAITGGQLVELVTGGAERRVQPAANGSLLVMGMALHDAATGAPVTVVSEGVWQVVAHGAITAGMRLKAFTAGTVQDAGATPDARLVIGFAIGDAADTTLCAVKFGGSL